MTNASGQMVYDYSKLKDGQYTYKAYHIEDNYYTFIETTGTLSLKKYDIIILDNQTVFASMQNSVKLNATIKDNQTNQIIRPTNTKLIFILPNGTEIEASLSGNSWYADYTFEQTGNYSISARLYHCKKQYL